jgi:lysophospholipase L1-like esterase
MSKDVWRNWLSIVAFSCSIFAIAASVVLGFAYENLRRQLVGISSDLARFPPLTISREHVDVRTFIIRLKLARATEPVVVLGDSIVEASDLPQSICGHTVVNAGIGGTTIGYFVRNTAQLLRGVKPSLVVLAVGINDTSSGGQADRIEPFREAYSATLQSLSAFPVAVATITPIGLDASNAYDASLVDRFNDVIRQLANGRMLVDLNKGLSGNFTVDGIHPNGDGHRLWNAEVVDAIGRALGCAASH